MAFDDNLIKIGDKAIMNINKITPHICLVFAPLISSAAKRLTLLTKVAKIELSVA